MVRGHHLRRRLHQLDQHPFPAHGARRVPLGVDEADVMARRPFPDPAGREPHAPRAQERVGRGKVVDPEADVVERGDVHFGRLVRVERLHQVHFHGPGAVGRAQTQNVLVDVLLLFGFGMIIRVGAWEWIWGNGKSKTRTGIWETHAPRCGKCRRAPRRARRSRGREGPDK